MDVTGQPHQIKMVDHRIAEIIPNKAQFLFAPFFYRQLCGAIQIKQLADCSRDGLQINLDCQSGTLANTGNLNQTQFTQFLLAQTLFCFAQAGLVLCFGYGFEYPSVADVDVDTDTQPIQQLRKIGSRLDVAGDADETAVDNNAPA